MRLLRLFLKKLLLNCYLDCHWLLAAPVSVIDRVNYVLRKYLSIFTNARRIQFLGRPFHYDNRLTPALLPDYVFEIQDLVKRIDFKQIHTVFDVGANIGQFSFALKNKYPQVQVYSFEPNSLVFPLLKINAGHFISWRCFEFGIGQANEKLPLYFVPGKSSQASLYPENAGQGLLGGHAQTTEIELKQINPELLRSLNIDPHVDLIKVDVEGAEREVLESLASLQWKYLFIELSTGRSGGISLEEALTLLQSQTPNPVTIVYSSKPAGPSQTFQVLFQCTQ